MAERQSYANHTRWYPLFHFVVGPLLALNFLSHLVRLIMAPSWSMAFWTLLSVTLILLALTSRMQPLKAQDRVIRLEERLRYRELLDPETAAKASALPVSQIVALRFASDAELPELVNRVISGELKTQKEIKMAIKDWRADNFRV